MSLLKRQTQTGLGAVAVRLWSFCSHPYALAIIAWLIARAVQQRGCLHRLEPVLPPPNDDASRVTVIIPARDEETNIEHCLEGLLAQDYPALPHARHRGRRSIGPQRHRGHCSRVRQAASADHIDQQSTAAAALHGKSHACLASASFNDLMNRSSSSVSCEFPVAIVRL